MTTELALFIEDKGLNELVREKKMYPQLRNMIRCQSGNQSIISLRMEKLSVAELNTNIAILYQLYKRGSLFSEFSCYVMDSNGSASFGGEAARFFNQSKVCRVLADLDIEKISASPRMSDLYHELRIEVDKTKKAGISFLHRVRFWELYFLFYNEYIL